MQDEAGNRRIGFGGRINLLRSYDLLLYRVFFDTKYLRKGTQVESQARKLIKTQVDSATDVGLYKELLLKLMTLIISIT